MTRRACIRHERQGGYSERCLSCHRAENGRLRLALRRLGSTETFTTGLDLRPKGSSREAIFAELQARMVYAIEASE